MRFILVGPSASGKNYLQVRMESQGARPGVSHTTRAAREGEVDGYDYHYISEDEFLKMESNGDFYEKVNYNGNHYGLTKDEFKKCDVVILNATGVNSIEEEDRTDSFVIYIDIPEDVRLLRMNGRGWDAETIKRRLVDDRIEFSDFTNYDLRITNPNF